MKHEEKTPIDFFWKNKMIILLCNLQRNINKYTKPCRGFTVPPHTKHCGLQQ
jgi:hypothetical protein